MFVTLYREIMRKIRLSDRFKADLVENLLNGQAPVSYTRKVLVAVAAILVVITTLGLAANIASNGKLYYALFGGQDPRTTDDYPAIIETTETTIPSETSEASTVPATDETIQGTTENANQETGEDTGVVTVESSQVPGTTTTETLAVTTAPAARPTPVVRAFAGENSVTVSWDAIHAADLIGYRVVASVGNSNPLYSKDGYYVWITDPGVTSCTITCGDPYWGGDVGVFYSGIAYNFSVTAIYGAEQQAIPGNAVQVTMPTDPAATPCPPGDPVPIP